ncbi:MFS transporter [Acidobacteria bacterium AB60]|nr:MFS transporter [Acidobacteria bacterium AB60]
MASVVILTAIGVGLVLPSLASAAVYGLPKDRFAVGSGVNQAVRQIGSVLGVAITVALAGAVQGPAAMTAFSRLFLVLAICGFATAAVSSVIDTHPNKETRTNWPTDPPRPDIGAVHSVPSAQKSEKRSQIAMNWVALQMLTGDRAKYLGLIFAISFSSFSIVQQASIFCGLMNRTKSQSGFA